MKWKVVTEYKTYTVETNSSRDAVDHVRKIDNTTLISVTLLPKTLTGKVKKFFKKFTKR
jgi:hypothetical protein